MLKKSITISEEQKDYILKYGSLSCDKTKGLEGNFSSKAQGFIDNCTSLIEVSEKRFLKKKLFNIGEIVFLIDVSKDAVYTNSFSYKDQLMIKVKEGVNYGNLEIKHSVDLTEFLAKIRCLNEIESFVLIMKMCEYWRNCYEVDLEDWINENFRFE